MTRRFGNTPDFSRRQTVVLESPDTVFNSVQRQALTEVEHAKNNLPDVLARWKSLNSPLPHAGEGLGERERPRIAQSFCVPKDEIAANGYDLSINRYKEVVHEVVEHLPPKDILANLAKLEAEIQAGMKELEGMLQ